MKPLIYLTLATTITISAQHSIPDSIRKEAGIALSHYPELEGISIEFKFKKRIKKSTMQAQPVFGSLFRNKRNRRYVVLISEKIIIANARFNTQDIPPNVMIGWLGHELGHIMDYRERSGLGLIGFGLKYYFSKKFIKRAERTADTYAVKHGMEDYILETKDFILNQAGISEKYKHRIKSLYLSPEEIMQLVRDREAILPAREIP